MAVGRRDIRSKARYGYKVRNLAVSKPINATQAKNMADNQIFSRETVVEYRQVLLRFSRSKQGLRNETPPPFVSK